MTKEEFIWKAIQIHGYKYDYRKVNFIYMNTKVCIICPKHGEFCQTPKNHLKGCGCFKCGVEFRASKQRYTIEQFIEKSRSIHGDKYDYSKVDYINDYTKICIICPEHGEFWQTPNKHLQGQSCPKCANNIKYTTEEFIEKAKEIYGNKYDYSKVNYVNAFTKVCIICHKKNKYGVEHGEFWQQPNDHLMKHGCPKCGVKNNVSEQKFNEALSSKLNTDIIYQYRDKTIFGFQNLDFYLPKYNIAIELQGHQHFIPVDFAGRGKKWANKQLIKTQKLDELKYNICKTNNIKLFYFTYAKNNILPKNYFSKLYTDIDELINDIALQMDYQIT